MKKILLIALAIFSIFIFSSLTFGQVATWDFTGENTVATSTADTSSANLAAAPVLTRGAGAAASAGANSFRTVGFQNNGIATTNTDYFEVKLTASAGNVLSISTIDARMAGTTSFAASPGVSQQFAYSTDGINFTLIGSPQIIIGSPQTLTQINTSGISALQNVPAGTTVSLRYYASGQTTTGGWGFNSPAAGQNGLTIGGFVGAPPDTTPPVLTYTPLPSTTSTSNPTLSVTATDAVGVTGATIFWSVDGGAFTSNACSPSGGTAQNGTWDCTITGALTNPSTISYYVTGQDAATNATSNPSSGASQPNVFTIGAATVPAGTYTNFNAGGGSTTGGDVTITGVLDLNGIISTPTTISLGCNATVSNAGPSSYVVGTVNKDYCAPALFIYPVGENGWTPVRADVTGGTFPSSLSAASYDAFLTGFDVTQSLSRNWALVETGSVVADLSFTYLPGDVNGTESNYRVWRREDSGILTDMCGAPCNAGAPTLGPVNGVSVFSRWTGSESLAPTAAGVKVSGRVLMPSGAGLRNAKVLMTDSQGITRTVTTSTFGYYAFDDVRSGETYVMRVVSKRFRYSTRTVQVNDEIANLDFVGLE